jgi:hypothetical protein
MGESDHEVHHESHHEDHHASHSGDAIVTGVTQVDKAIAKKSKV